MTLQIRYMKRVVLLFCLYPFLLSAQESDILKLMIKETLKPEFLLEFSHDLSDSILLIKPLQLDATKKYMPVLGFDYKMNHFLLLSLDDPILSKSQEISKHITTLWVNREKFDSRSIETTNDVVSNYVLTPIASIIMINPFVFIDCLFKTGIIPNDPYIPKKSRKERMLKIITQDVYHIDDYK